MALSLLMLSLLLVLLERSTAEGLTWQAQVINVLGIIGAPILGALIASRRPDNPYGWLWLSFGLAFALLSFAGSYTEYAVASVENPFGVGGRVGEAISALIIAGVFVIFGYILLSALSLIFRYRRTGGVERQQIKWFAYAAVVFGGSIIFGGFLGRDLPGIWDALFETVTFAGLYVAVGIAIFRYRLYDIDVIINRTLVYGTLTAALAVVYVGSIVSLQALFRTLTDQESQLAVVVSTLAIAALFGPLRRRVQAFIDRRFYRRKYDAARTLEVFSAKLRNETDLDRLGDEMVAVVRETMQPAHVSLWLRPSGRIGGEER